jgi:PepB aminopeptidase
LSDQFNVTLSPYVAPKKWGKSSLISFDDEGATIHMPHQDATLLRSLQQAARTLNRLGVPEVYLNGEQWSLEKQWAFYRGYQLGEPKYSCQFATLSTDEMQRLQRRIIAVSMVKEWVDTPPNQQRPLALCQSLGAWIKQLDSDNVTIEIIEGKALQQAGWAGICAVGQGSSNPPAMLQIDFNPTEDPHAPTYAVLVGKGITFDSGGYSLKSPQGMAVMKLDMAGGATVVGALGLAMLNGLKRRIRVIVCAAENLVDGHSLLLGDVIEYKNGVSVEVLNSDAEGRLVLADGLLKASEYQPDLLIDAATLTGASITAVGEDYIAHMSVNENLHQRWQGAAAMHQEYTWRLPLEPWHAKQFPSYCATTANSIAKPGGGPGAASCAAGFLSRFVSDLSCWLHLDLASAYQMQANHLWGCGATGNGVLALASILIDKPV